MRAGQRVRPGLTKPILDCPTCPPPWPRGHQLDKSRGWLQVGYARDTNGWALTRGARPGTNPMGTAA